MTREEMLACLTDRPCDVCKFHTEKGCKKWSCVFEEEPDDAENKDKWIPVSERLPEVDEGGLSEWVLVTLNSFGKIITMYDRICHGGWLSECFDGEEVLAWQPLPEPYKAEKGGE